MNTKQPREHYQVIITSGTDARKKPVSFSLSKRTIIVIIAIFSLIIAACLTVSFMAFGQFSGSQKQIEDLSQKIESQSKKLEDYAAQITTLQESMQGNGKTVSNITKKSSSPASSLNAPAPEDAEAAGDEVLGSLAWPLQSPDSGFDADWPGPEGYYHAPRGSGVFHEGVDICAAHETPIAAVSDGEVVSNGWNDDGGWMVEILSPDGYVFRYLHMSAQSPLTVGTVVNKSSTVIGNCGNTGGDYPNHLHLSIYLPDSAETIDPTPYLKAAEGRFQSKE